MSIDPDFEFFNKCSIVEQNISEAAILEQLAEECSELAHAALKKARKLRGENYTPKSLEEIQHDLLEEFTDVMLCTFVLGLPLDEVLMKDKLDRWIKRNNL